MAVILRDVPFTDGFTTIEVRGRSYRIFPYQIVVWVSLGFAGRRKLDPHAPRFPAILDTAFTDNFVINKQQLAQFAGLQPESLSSWGEDLRTHGRRIPIREANLWLHPNRPGERDAIADRQASLVELHRGIGICDDADNYPRLPLLGARALRQGRLQLFVDYSRCRTSLRTPTKFWFLNWRW
jgi:hypothetical protein